MRKSDFTLPTLDDLFSTQADDFERDTITIKHIVTNAKIDGKCEIVCADRAKTKSSLRSLPLVSNIREKAAGAEGAAKGESARMRKLLQQKV